MLARRSIHIWLSPRIQRYVSALEVRTVPRRDAAGGLHQDGKPLGARRIAPGVEIEEIERAREALDLNLRGLDLGFAEIVQHPRADQSHDHADDRDDDENFHQSEAALAAPVRALNSSRRSKRCLRHGTPPLRYPTTWLTDRRAVITDTISPPTTMLMTMIASGPAIPTMRSSAR